MDKEVLNIEFKDEKEYKTARGDLDELVLYLKDLYEVIVNDDPFPIDIKSVCAAELDNNARSFDSDNKK